MDNNELLNKNKGRSVFKDDSNNNVNIPKQLVGLSIFIIVFVIFSVLIQISSLELIIFVFIDIP